MSRGIYEHKKRGPLSEETKKKISLALMGHTFSKATIRKFRKMRKGKPTWNKGIPHSDETRARISVGIRGKNNPRWNNGRRCYESGYIEVKVPTHPHKNNGYVMEHRLVVEKIIGRYLKPSEPVHHVNSERGDNRPENLIALKDAASHRRLEVGQNINASDIIFDGRKLATI